MADSLFITKLSALLLHDIYIATTGHLPSWPISRSQLWPVMKESPKQQSRHIQYHYLHQS